MASTLKQNQYFASSSASLASATKDSTSVSSESVVSADTEITSIHDSLFKLHTSQKLTSDQVRHVVNQLISQNQLQGACSIVNRFQPRYEIFETDSEYKELLGKLVDDKQYFSAGILASRMLHKGIFPDANSITLISNNLVYSQSSEGLVLLMNIVGKLAQADKLFLLTNNFYEKVCSQKIYILHHFYYI